MRVREIPTGQLRRKPKENSHNMKGNKDIWRFLKKQKLKALLR